MMHHLLGRLLGGLMATALVVSAGAWVLERTVWSADYVQQKAADTKLADGLATHLPAVIGRTTSNPGETEVMLQQVLTPSFVRGQLQIMIPGLIHYYREGAPIPALNLSALQERLTDEGFVLPAGLAKTLQQPQPITPGGTADEVIQAGAGRVAQLLWLAPLLALIMAGLIVLLTGHRRFIVLSEGLLGAGLGTLALAGLATLPPGLAASALATSPAKELQEPVRTFMAAISHDQTWTLIWIAGTFGVALVVLSLIHLFFKLFGRHHEGHH